MTKHPSGLLERDPHQEFDGKLWAVRVPGAVAPIW
jgi:hypothetical protein